MIAFGTVQIGMFIIFATQMLWYINFPYGGANPDATYQQATICGSGHHLIFGLRNTVNWVRIMPGLCLLGLFRYSWKILVTKLVALDDIHRHLAARYHACQPGPRIKIARGGKTSNSSGGAGSKSKINEENCMTTIAASTQEKFSVAAMLENASVETGLGDFGEGEFRESLTRLVDATNAEMTLSPLGVAVFKGEVHRILVNRLRFAEDLKRHPEILDEAIDDPIVVLGMPRTGSTKLQRMMAADPTSQGLRFWQMMNPAPFPDTSADGEDPRIETGRQALAMLAQAAPGFMQSHPTQVADADEEVFLQLYTFKCLLTYLGHPAHSYLKWLLSVSLRSTYGYMKQLLQYLQWQNGGKRGRPWILKSPVHLGNLDLLVDTFPRAQYVFTHRNLHEVIPSFCRLTEMSWRIKTDAIDMNQVGRVTLDLWSGEMKKHLRQREALGSRVDIFDVQYEQIKSDPIGLISEIYRRAGRELTPPGLQAMKTWEKSDAYGRFGKYSYQLEDYGLTHDEIDSAFKEYNQKFGQ